MPASAQRWGWTPPFGLAAIALLSALASVASQLGDLGESALKRRFDVKDSSQLIPGQAASWTGSTASGRCALCPGVGLLARRAARALAMTIAHDSRRDRLGRALDRGRRARATPTRFRVEARWSAAAMPPRWRLARPLGARFAALADERGGADLKAALSGSGIASGAGEAAVLEAVERDADIVLAAISGTAGLRRPTPL